LEDQKGKIKEKQNHQLYELARAKGIAVKEDEGETNRRDVEVDRHCLERDGDAYWKLEAASRESSCWWESHGCSSRSPPERGSVKIGI